MENVGNFIHDSGVSWMLHTGKFNDYGIRINVAPSINLENYLFLEHLIARSKP
uniref:Uncharacterized protein n=1 Tax=Rhizophagus irregularis (strain DAOM 181602 / DAOM 197198 / MUCL 43194) TaxID=747089 RepID=U9TQN3_RHIID